MRLSKFVVFGKLAELKSRNCALITRIKISQRRDIEFAKKKKNKRERKMNQD